MLGLRDMLKMDSDSDSDLENVETLGPFFNKHYSQLLKFLPQEDINTMSILNKEWNKRVDSYNIFASLVNALRGEKKQTSKPAFSTKQASKIQKIESTKTQINPVPSQVRPQTASRPLTSNISKSRNPFYHTLLQTNLRSKS